MNLLELSLKNVRRSFGLYTIYGISMLIGIMIFFSFSSVMYNDDILDALKNIQNFDAGFLIASAVIVSFILLFVLYANSFFIRQRKKELGLYMLYGMNERHLLSMLFYETLAIGAVALVIGGLLGGLLSKVFGALLMNLMKYDQVVSLDFPVRAIIASVIVFVVLHVAVSIQSYLLVTRVQLIDLFRAKEQQEKPIRTSAALAILGFFLLGSALAMIGGGKQSAFWTDYSGVSLIYCAIGIIGGTYLFFRQFAGWLLQVWSRTRGYLSGNTTLWTSAIRFQIRGNTLNLTFISLFSTMLVLLVCFVSINYSVQFEAVGRNLPNDIAYESKSAAVDAEVKQAIQASGHGIEGSYSLKLLRAKAVTDPVVAFENPEYFSPGILLASASDYNAFVQRRGDDQQVRLAGDAAVSLSQGMDVPLPVAGSGTDFAIRTGSSQKVFKLVEKKDYALLGWSSDPVLSMNKKAAVLIISDDAFASLKASGTAMSTFQIYDIADAGDAESLSEQLHGIVTKDPETYYSSFADVYSKQIEGSSLLLFAGAFLALIALFALASVIYFKQLREATEARRQFAILRKLGVGRREMMNVIRKQLLFVFALPLLPGLLSSWLIIKTYILDSVQDFPNLIGMVWGIIALYFLIYAGFYLVSTNLYYRIANRTT
ncbi:ABC transporter permease [Paenibacillus sacheonensis]|uniref:FtsX-like permease family protein n=1 Tax=Paenibacillus sacheonensis TaxID=742054 RepID=A0A7X4YL94_9BACL|nr:ABC transporter permease [Paenibacillus sacheonensis]MBM7563924.1 putative ABC transport system permease protein [Paenibacillus sacheonensis]NBC67731.1 FtsX-like permease family protein [Paenibacillus sacheonensis]